MQLENIKWVIHLTADGKRRFGSASGRCHLAGAVGGTVARASGVLAQHAAQSSCGGGCSCCDKNW